MLETRKVKIDLSKSMLFLEVGLLAGMGAIVALMPRQGGPALLLWLSLTMAVISILAEVFYLHAKVAELEVEMLSGSNAPSPLFPWWLDALGRAGVYFSGVVAGLSLVGALVLFVLYLGFSLP